MGYVPKANYFSYMKWHFHNILAIVLHRDYQIYLTPFFCLFFYVWIRYFISFSFSAEAGLTRAERGRTRRSSRKRNGGRIRRRKSSCLSIQRHHIVFESCIQQCTLLYCKHRGRARKQEVSELHICADISLCKQRRLVVAVSSIYMLIQRNARILGLF